MSVNTHRAKNIRLTIIDKYKDSISFSGRNFVLIFILVWFNGYNDKKRYKCFVLALDNLMCYVSLLFLHHPF